MKKKTTALAAPFGVWMAIFTIVPLGIVLWFAFTDGNGQFTFDNVREIFAYDASKGETLWHDSFVSTIVYSLWLGVLTTIISLILAYPIAFSISRASEHTQQTMVLLVMLPMWMNFLLRTQAIKSLLSSSGLISQCLMFVGLEPLNILNTDTAIVLGLVYDFLPYMILPLYSVMVKIDKSEIEAAQDLGANTLSVFRRVVLPLSVPGILNGITMVFVPSVSTFVISTLLGGSKRMMIGDVIESMFVGVAPNLAVGSALSLVLMVLFLVCMACTRLADKNDDDEKGGMML
ncbi:MAG: ABC transporter permease [Clostridia bacterium]|nr:ABC transporter permease [Clostridia bacterium]